MSFSWRFKRAYLARWREIAAGVVEGLVSGSVPGGAPVHGLLQQLDRELKRLVSEGPQGFNNPAPQELTKDLLFHLAKASFETPRIAELRARFRLDQALLGQGATTAAGPAGGVAHPAVTRGGDMRAAACEGHARRFLAGL